jgi:ABC-type amino acid transport substrate-binding protein
VVLPRKWDCARLILLAIAIGAIRLLFQYTIDFEYRKVDVIAGMYNLEVAGEATVHDRLPPALPPLANGQSRLQAIKERGSIRVGYVPSQLPYSFTNTAGELVGLDIEMAHLFAEDLGVALELVPLGYDSLFQRVFSPPIFLLVFPYTCTIQGLSPGRTTSL